MIYEICMNTNIGNLLSTSSFLVYMCYDIPFTLFLCNAISSAITVCIVCVSICIYFSSHQRKNLKHGYLNRRRRTGVRYVCPRL